MRPGQGCDFAAEIAARPVDAFAEREPHVSGDLDRRADLALGLLGACATLFLSSKMKA